MLQVGSKVLAVLPTERGRLHLLRGQRPSQRSAWGRREGLGRKGGGSNEEGLESEKWKNSFIKSGNGEGVFILLFILIWRTMLGPPTYS